MDQVARSDVARVQIRPRDSSESADMYERVSANCYFWIGKLGIGVRRGLAGKESESERLSPL